MLTAGLCTEGMINIEANEYLSKKKSKEERKGKGRKKKGRKMIWMVPFVNFCALVLLGNVCVCVRAHAYICLGDVK